MEIQYRKATINDAELLIKLYNKAFYADYLRYGECPAYGRTTDRMIESIRKIEKHIIYADQIPVGVISLENKGDGNYYIGCLAVIPEYQHRGIGSGAVKFALNHYSDWKTITLKTPSDKTENINFYTIKCGFDITGSEMDGNVNVYNFILKQ